MTITARYASQCSACHQPITVGEQIEWTKGGPVRHAACSRGPVTRDSAPGAGAWAKRRSQSRAPHGRCDECGTTAYPVRPCRDSSGLLGQCCPRCAGMSRYERSFA